MFVGFEGAVGLLDQLVILLDLGRLDPHRGQQARREHVDLGIVGDEAVGEEVVVETGPPQGPLIAPAGILPLVLARDDMALEVDLHGRVAGIHQDLSVGPVPGLPLFEDRPGQITA